MSQVTRQEVQGMLRQAEDVVLLEGARQSFTRLEEVTESLRPTPRPWIPAVCAAIGLWLVALGTVFVVLLAGAWTVAAGAVGIAIGAAVLFGAVLIGAEEVGR